MQRKKPTYRPNFTIEQSKQPPKVAAKYWIYVLNWGANMNTLLLTYRTIVRTKMDYEFIVYNSASHQKTRPYTPPCN